MTAVITDGRSPKAVGREPSARPPAAAAPEAIRVEHLSVRLELQKERVTSLREQIIRLAQRRRAETEEFWPVRDVSFTVGRGEAYGIVGRNGAGKSTLLKVIAGVLSPTRGEVSVRGRVAPLLELGAGFDAELTGRENIYLYGSLLGFSRRRLQERFDRMVEFAELEEFIDVPLKNYSSGMATRLGFAVASDVDADVLIVDEALTVGDARFQLKCMERIESYVKAGITILLVSHTPDHVQRLCRNALWIEHGEVRLQGPADEVLAAYNAGEYEAPAHATVSSADVAPAVELISITDEDAAAANYAFVDVSTDGGHSTRAVARRFGGVGVGVAGDEASVGRIRGYGFDSMLAHPLDVDFPDASVGFVSLVGVLHFLPGIWAVESLVARATHWARDFVFIRMPSYEDESFLRAVGLKFFWHDWTGAQTHPRLDQLLGILNSLGHEQYSVRYRYPAISSDATSLIPVNAPPDQQEYDPLIHGPKAPLAFPRPVYEQIDVYIALRPFEREAWRAIVGAPE